MKKLLYIILPISIFSSVVFVSCDEVNAIVDGLTDSLSTEEVVEGLKTALEVGTDSSSSELSEEDGYYGDPLVKIPLPEEAEKVRQQIVTLSSYSGLDNVLDLDDEFEKVVHSINKSAEEAAKEAAPIFKTAITDMSISDGWDILNGINPASETKADGFDSTAATQYFKVKTQAALVELFGAKIDVALDKKTSLGFSANEAWTGLRNSINTTLQTINSKPLILTAYNLATTASGVEITPIEQATIGTFATEKALDGLFFKVGEEEKKIRRDPFQWALDILHRVFGWDSEK